MPTFDFRPAWPERRGWRRGDRGVVGVNLVLVIAFALYAVIMLSRTTLAAKQIDDRVRVIVTEVGPGSNVSRLDETQKLNTIGRTAEDILTAARPLSGQAQTILDTARSIDNTVSGIQGNANEINATVKSINSTAASLLPVVQEINGDGSLDPLTGGVSAINMRADIAKPVVAGISDDLGQVLGQVGFGDVGGHTGGNIHTHVNSINCALTSPSGGLVGTVGSLLNLVLGTVTGAPPGCNAF
jgi:hypothetical protein